MSDNAEIAGPLLGRATFLYHHILGRARGAGRRSDGKDRSEVTAVSVRQPARGRPIPQRWRVHPIL
jgi:hypothetical protein